MDFKNISELKKFLTWAATQKTFTNIEIGGVRVSFREPDPTSLLDSIKEPQTEDDYKEMLFYSGSKLNGR